MARSETAAPLVLRLLGPFEAQVNGRPLPRLRTRKGASLLALLALRSGQETDRAWLAGTLWPESGEREGYASLRRCLTDLRRNLGQQAGLIEAPTAHSLRLDLSSAWVDVLEFDAALARADAASLERAVRLYRGPLLEASSEEWALAERRSREEGCLEALERLGARSMATGDAQAAAAWLRRAVALDPLRETAWRALLEALTKDGRHAAAVEAYRELRDYLRREMNADPSPATTALFHEIRAQVRRQPAASVKPQALSPKERIAPADAQRLTLDAQRSDVERSTLHAPRSTNLPRPLTEFVGRRQEVGEAAALLTRTRLLTLTGAGGVGKTRLAIEVAACVGEEFADGAWFVDLAPIAPQPGGTQSPDPALLPRAVAGALGVSGLSESRPEQPPLDALAGFLAEKHLLLVLDNCEHLAAACADLVEALLSAAPRLRILATSRQVLGVPGETVWRVPSLSLPAEEGIQVFGSSGIQGLGAASAEPSRIPEYPNTRIPEYLMQFEAVQLFIQRAMAVRPSFGLTRENAAAVVQVCRRLDGIPLALELAAARLNLLSVEQVAARMDDRFRLLTGGARSTLPRQQTLRATLEWSYDLLNDAERSLLRRLSVFPGSFTLEAAEAVVSGGVVGGEWSDTSHHPPALRVPALTTHQTLDLLSSLVDRSLVWVEEVSGEARYRLLETTREYAQEQLVAGGEMEELQRRHAAYFASLAQRAEPHLSAGPAQAAWLERLEEARHDLRATLEWCLRPAATAPETALALRTAVALKDFWFTRGHWTEARGWLERVLARPGGPLSLRAQALIDASLFARPQGDLSAARALAETALAAYEELGEQTGIARACAHLGWIYARDEDLPAARAFHERSLRIRRTLGDRSVLPGSLNSLGVLAEREGDFRAARELHQEALAICRELDLKEYGAWSLEGYAWAAWAQADLEAARPAFREGTELFARLENPYGLLSTLSGLASVLSAESTDEAVLCRAARLHGAAEALDDRLGTSANTKHAREREAMLRTLLSRLGVERCAAERAAGRELELSDAVALALAPAHGDFNEALAQPRGPH